MESQAPPLKQSCLNCFQVWLVSVVDSVEVCQSQGAGKCTYRAAGAHSRPRSEMFASKQDGKINSKQALVKKISKF